jgi:hypothetical protein
MSPKAELAWDEGAPPEQVTSREALEARLRELSERLLGQPIVACLSLLDGTSAHIGLGRKEGMVFVFDPKRADGNTTEWISVGDEHRRGESSFWFLGDHNDYEKRSFLPIADAIRGVGELFETGHRPTWIRWEESSF